MKRRQTLKLMGAVGATASMAGCGVLGGCGPGKNEIGHLAKVEKGTATRPGGQDSAGTYTEPNVVGEIQSIGDNEIIIDDGTGTAKLTTRRGGGFQTTNVGEGDCAEATGDPDLPEDGADYDLTFYVDEIGLANE